MLSDERTEQKLVVQWLRTHGIEATILPSPQLCINVVKFH